MSAGGIKFCYPLAPELILQPPKNIISGPLILAVWPYLGRGGLPETLTLAHSYFYVSNILMSFK